MPYSFDGALRNLGLLVAAPLAISLTSFDANAQDFEWNSRLRPGQTLEINGVIGDIRAVSVRGDQAQVIADKREGRKGYAEDVEFEVIEHRDGVTICAMYPRDRRNHRNECRTGEQSQLGSGDNDTEVTFTVEVPEGVLFSGRTVTGDIDARSLDGDVEAFTVTGDIDVSTRGFARANTVTGHIHAAMGSADWTGELKISTVTGRIVVDLPEGTGADVHAKTVTGGINTDFPLTVRGRFMSKRVSGTIGGGGRELSLQTVTGSIRLRQSSD